MSRRTEQVAAVVQSEVGMMLLFEKPNPEFGLLSVSRVGVSDDCGQARVYISASNKDASFYEIKHVLDKLRGKFQRELGQKVKMKRTPKIKLFVDHAGNHYNTIESICKELKEDQSE